MYLNLDKDRTLIEFDYNPYIHNTILKISIIDYKNRRNIYVLFNMI